MSWYPTQVHTTVGTGQTPWTVSVDLQYPPPHTSKQKVTDQVRSLAHVMKRTYPKCEQGTAFQAWSWDWSLCAHPRTQGF